MMFGGGDGAAVGMLREGMGSTTEGADNQVGGALAAVNGVTEPVAAGALGEKRATYEWLDRASIDSKEGGGTPLHHFQAGAVGVMESEDNTGGVFAWWEVSWVSEPTGREKDLSAVTDGVARELPCEVIGGGDGTVGAAADGNSAKNDMAETRDGDAMGARAKGGAENVVKDGDVFGGWGAFKCEYEIFAEGVGGRPPSGEELEGGVNGVKSISDITDEFARVHGVK